MGVGALAVELVRDPNLARGSVALPEGTELPAELNLTLGGNRAAVRSGGGAPAGQLRLAPDVWDQLSVPFDGLRLHMRHQQVGSETTVELGPVIVVLYPGRERSVPRRVAAARARYSFGHLQSEPGLWAIGFANSIDWDQGALSGYVVDNRPGQPEAALPARLPMPDAVRLTWSIPRDVIEQLRERTGGRTFNWVRNLGKWQFYKQMAADPKLSRYLPETRLFKDQVDLAAMLTRHGTIFVKNVFGIKGRGSARVDRRQRGFLARYMNGNRQEETTAGTLAELLPKVRRVVGRRRVIVQQGIPLTGKEGRGLDFRVLTVRTEAGGWCCPLVMAKVAPDDRLTFTNVANGATDEDAVESLKRHHGMTQDEAEVCIQQMTALCLDAARALEGPLHPLGIVGFDVIVERDTHRLWLLEANTVPGFGYGAETDAALARTQVDYARFLAGYGPESP
jgi:glutathione synthase/RimK-type ligase-like ATP-grasp enzyme